MEPSPFISKVDNSPKAGLQMSVLDIDLDIVRNMDEAAEDSDAGDRELTSATP
ncbi:MAG: hypothetical protein WBA01_05495 [Phormidesmis sp.]